MPDTFTEQYRHIVPDQIRLLLRQFREELGSLAPDTPMHTELTLQIKEWDDYLLNVTTEPSLRSSHNPLEVRQEILAVERRRFSAILIGLFIFFILGACIAYRFLPSSVSDRGVSFSRLFLASFISASTIASLSFTSIFFSCKTLHKRRLQLPKPVSHSTSTASSIPSETPSKNLTSDITSVVLSSTLSALILGFLGFVVATIAAAIIGGILYLVLAFLVHAGFDEGAAQTIKLLCRYVILLIGFLVGAVIGSRLDLARQGLLNRFRAFIPIASYRQTIDYCTVLIASAAILVAAISFSRALTEQVNRRDGIASRTSTLLAQADAAFAQHRFVEAGEFYQAVVRLLPSGRDRDKALAVAQNALQTCLSAADRAFNEDRLIDADKLFEDAARVPEWRSQVNAKRASLYSKHVVQVFTNRWSEPISLTEGRFRIYSPMAVAVGVGSRVLNIASGRDEPVLVSNAEGTSGLRIKSLRSQMVVSVFMLTHRAVLRNPLSNRFAEGRVVVASSPSGSVALVESSDTFRKLATEAGDTRSSDKPIIHADQDDAYRKQASSSSPHGNSPAVIPSVTAQEIESPLAIESVPNALLDQQSFFDLPDGVKLPLIRIKAGSFTMGSPASEKGRFTDETQRSVRITREFFMGESEVTQGQWLAVMRTNPWKGQEYVREGDNFPATHVSWHDAGAFCKSISEGSGRLVRLPLEAEWEYACRAGTSTPYAFDDSVQQLADYGWFGGLVGDGNAKHAKYAHQVKQKKSNSWGLYDMHGNVYEWCSDSYDKSTYVLRGGSWNFYANYCRSAARNKNGGDSRSSSFGFRIVVDLKK